MSLLEAAIRVLAPPQCIACRREGSALCSDCSTALISPFGERCWRCNKLSLDCRTCVSCRSGGAPVHVWIVTDYDRTARELLSLYKFGHQRAAATPISKLMISVFRKYADNLTGYLVSPVPTATTHIRQRGFGHSELLARKIAAELNLPYFDALRRLDQTRQLGAKREDRLKQLENSFAVKRPNEISGQRILLIDDVVTTGGTLIAATKALRSAGTKSVGALLFAKRL